MRPLLYSFSAAILAALAGCTPPPDPAGTGAPAAPSGGTTGRVKIGMMPKAKGIPYFNACEKGAREAAAELPEVELVYDGPLKDESELQSGMLDTWSLQKYGAIAVACNDPDQIVTSLDRARDDGSAVITWDADAPNSKRQFFVNQAKTEELTHALVDDMATQAGADAQVAVVSSSPTAPNQSAWLKQMEAYRKEKYPAMSVVTTEYAGENQTQSLQKAQNILKAYPGVKGIWGMTSVAFPGAAQAVEQAGKSGKVAVVGLGQPTVMKPFVKRGVVKSVLLWNVPDLGYLTVYVARAAAKGEIKEGSTSITAGRLGEIPIAGQEIVLGPPMRFTKENIDQFDF